MAISRMSLSNKKLFNLNFNKIYIFFKLNLCLFYLFDEIILNNEKCEIFFDVLSVLYICI